MESSPCHLLQQEQRKPKIFRMNWKMRYTRWVGSNGVIASPAMGIQSLYSAINADEACTRTICLVFHAQRRHVVYMSFDCRTIYFEFLIGTSGTRGANTLNGFRVFVYRLVLEGGANWLWYIPRNPPDKTISSNVTDTYLCGTSVAKAGNSIWKLLDASTYTGFWTFALGVLLWQLCWKNAEMCS